VKRRDFLLAGLLAAGPARPAVRQRFTQGLLWRVSRKGVAPSYVYGTIHVADPRLAALPALVRKVFAGARSLMVEFLPDAYTEERFLEAALLPQPHTLEEVIGPEDFQRAVRSLQPIGLTPEFINRLKPWGVLLNLREQRAAQGAPIDTQLVDLARLRHIPFSQIEGVEEQIFTFDEFPMDAQVALLKHSLAHRDELLALSDRTLEAYVAGDLATIWRLREQFADRYPEISQYQAVMTKRVIYDRSVVMAFRMQRELRHGAAFVALGALHLFGEKGVLALLEQDGYLASRVS
jgi:hypothetical protein